jgi:glutamate-ammonia-ligase adenylyltransferase
MPPLLADPVALRRFFGREMLRIQGDSICLRAPIFTTLQRTSALADCAIQTAYAMAVERVSQSHPPASASYRPQNQMMIIALGRLGMLEFDLGSDADIVFVLPDEDGDEIAFWTHVAARVIDVLTSYTGEGVMFTIDTRLRPNGREGQLVQRESLYKDYFAKTAQAWEGITYMKSRAVAGNMERGTQFLAELQDVDWRRYGQAGRSKQELRQMRQRLENEVGSSHPLKAGRGGYYDIDFALMYLRLKSAGFFFPVLNTPARINVIEKMGHLDRSDAAFMLDAATFYRALDHGLRLATGHSEGRLPNAQMQLEMLEELVARWTPDHLHDQPLPRELAQIQERTRECFNRLFKQ